MQILPEVQEAASQIFQMGIFLNLAIYYEHISMDFEAMRKHILYIVSFLRAGKSRD